jgi:hypothetical protein
MLEYFKGNPAALLDALPSPTGSEEDKKALGDFRTGLTPQRGMSTKFGSKFQSVNGVNRPPGVYPGSFH